MTVGKALDFYLGPFGPENDGIGCPGGPGGSGADTSGGSSTRSGRTRRVTMARASMAPR